jgi:hypothetical protein
MSAGIHYSDTSIFSLDLLVNLSTITSRSVQFSSKDGLISLLVSTERAAGEANSTQRRGLCATPAMLCLALLH